MHHLIGCGWSGKHLKKAGLGREVNAYQNCWGSLGVSKLMFVDDSLLFFKASAEEANAVQKALALFQNCSGQLLSPSKCSILFSERCPNTTQERIKETLGVVSATFESKYFGLPTPEGKMKDDNFQQVMDRFGKRCNDWSEMCMSHAAKEALVTSVAQALPTHVMSVFKISVGFCEKYEKLIRKF